MDEKVTLRASLVGLYLLSVPVFSYSSVLGLSIIPQIIGMAVVACAIYDIIINGSITKNIPVFFYFIFAIWSLIPFIFSDYQDDPSSLMTLFKVTIITMSVAVLIKTKKDFNIVIFLFFSSIFVIFLLNRGKIDDLIKSEEITGVDRFSGTLENANKAAIYSMAIIWAAFTIAITIRVHKIVLFILILGVLIASFIIFYSGSRKGIIGLIVLASSLVWVLNRRFGSTFLRRAIITLLSFLALFLLFHLIIYNSPFLNRYLNMISGTDSSFQTRKFLIIEAISVWSYSLKNMLLGIGISNFRYYNDLQLFSHSTITETLVCSGLIGFVLYFSSFGSIFVSSFEAYKVISQREKIQVILIFVFLIMLFLFSMASVLLSDRLFWPLLGVISAHVINLKNNSLQVSI